MITLQCRVGFRIEISAKREQIEVIKDKDIIAAFVIEKEQ